MTDYLLQLINVALVLAVSPALVGLIRWLKARMQNRRGAPIWQPYFELRKLFGKEVVVSDTASWVFRATPYILFASTLAVALLVPLVRIPVPAALGSDLIVVVYLLLLGTFFLALAGLDTGSPFGGMGSSREMTVAALLVPLVRIPVPVALGSDLIVVVYLLLLGTFFLALAGLDTGSPFGGMGSSREMTVAALAEPTIALAIFSLAVGAGSTDLGRIVAETLNAPTTVAAPGHLLGFAALFIVMLAETGRLPVDNPSTHLELTMIHEAMILEYSGRYLALIEWASGMKLFIFLSLLANLYVPWGIATSNDPAAVLLGTLTLLGKVVVLGCAIAALETRLAKLRLFRVPELLSVSFVLALLAVTSSFVVR